MVQTVSVDVESGSYQVDIGERILSRVARALEKKTTDVTKLFILSDDNVSEHWLDPLEQVLEDGSFPVDHFVIPAGERSKSVDQLEEIWTYLLNQKGDRSSVIAALGGGVVGDLAGFAAASYMRGISLVHVPTSLLAQVDSCIGGKVGINLPAAKNAVGAFYPPYQCCIDIQTLSTLPEREFREGLAETVKYGLIMDAEFLGWIEDHLNDILERRSDALQYLVEQSVECKVNVVERDEKESGLRQILNFGHTLGHGIESATSYGTYLHGEAIAAGMLGSIDLSDRAGISTDDTLFSRVERLFKKIDLPCTVEGVDVDDILPHLKHDKKSKKGEPRWVLIESAGNVNYGNVISRDHVVESIKTILS